MTLPDGPYKRHCATVALFTPHSLQLLTDAESYPMTADEK